MHRSAPRGFTLIEVMVALALGALVVLLAHGLFRSVADGVERLITSHASLDRAANMRRWLIQAVGSIETGTIGGDHPFDGAPHRVEFTTWRRAAIGGFAREQLVIHRLGDSLVAVSDGLDTLMLADSIAHVGFDYLVSPGAESAWVRVWESPVSAPLAVRMRLVRAGATNRIDTLLLVVGPRG